MISVIIVAYNEEALIRSIIGELRKQQFSPEYEIILADGGSTDATALLAEKEAIQVTICRKGKACQMNDAAKIAKGDVLFFVHADMQLPENTLSLIQQHIGDGFDAGGFANVFDTHNDWIKQLGTWMNFRFFDNQEQSDKGFFYGDNGIFVKKAVFERLGGFKEIPIMEDYDFSLRLRQKFKTIKIKEPRIILSARRHIKAGFLKTRLQWIMIRKLYKWGIAPEKLARWYSDIR
ncbi:MAG: rSAM/selenodomain-associated transferase 2 [Saprospiraceae bacterium]|jgi:rSAM/selenodomain-associated transferase 2